MDNAAKWGLIATLIGVIIAVLALLRDLVDFKVQPYDTNPIVATTTKQIEKDTSREDRKQHAPEENNIQSCTFELLKGLEDSSEIELSVKLEGKHSDQFTSMLKQELENKIARYIPDKSITLNTSGSAKSKASDKKYYFLLGNFNVTFKSTAEVAPEIGQINLITGSSTGGFVLYKASIKNRISNCPVFLNLAGIDKKEITNNLITSIFKNI
ncbi:MAG: hypothetical protein IPO86_00480 [Saprospiraceae bacterium]|nr:hypothetical protein [Saprospiraceae bacterium]MBK9726572.1 hypothetical protein [Saprospiraceae bacterium]